MQRVGRTDATEIKNLSFTIQNTIVTADLAQNVDIKRLNDYSWGRYDIEDNYNGRVGYVKDSKMQGRVTVFTSGKLISTGAKSITHAVFQLEHTMNLLGKNGFARKVALETQVRNIVATSSLGRGVDLNMASIVLSKSIFEPEQFPGMIHKTEKGPTFLIFASGKMVIAGAKSEEDISSSLAKVSKQLQPFRV